jgi:hypothetical protein
MIKSRRMRPEGHIARMGEKWNIYIRVEFVGETRRKETDRKTKTYVGR